MKRKTPEHKLQTEIVHWLRNSFATDATLVFAVPMGELRHPRVAARLKAEGAMAGVADLCIVEDGYVLFMELKALKGVLSDAQKSFLSRATRAGAWYSVCWSLENAKQTATLWRGTRNDY